MNRQSLRWKQGISVVLILFCLLINGCSFQTLASAQIGNASDNNIRLQAAGYPRDQNKEDDLIFNRLSIVVTQEHPFMLRMPDGGELAPHELTETKLRQRYPDLEAINPVRDDLSYRSKSDKRSYITFSFDKLRRVSYVSIDVCRTTFIQVLGDSNGKRWFDVPITLDELTLLFGKPDFAGTLIVGGPAGKHDCLP